MKEIQEFFKQFEELKNKIDNMEELGCIELRQMVDDLDSIRERIPTIRSDIGRILLQSEFDPEEVSNALIRVNAIADEFIESNEHVSIKNKLENFYNHKWSYAQTVSKQLGTIQGYIRENSVTLRDAESELAAHNARFPFLTDTLSIAIMEETIRGDEKRIRNTKMALKKYEKDAEELRELGKTLLHGGVVPVNEKIDVDDVLREFEKDATTVQEEPKKDNAKRKFVKVNDTPKTMSIDDALDYDDADDFGEGDLLTPPVKPKKEQPISKSKTDEDDIKLELPTDDEPNEEIDTPVFGPITTRDEDDSDLPVIDDNVEDEIIDKPKSDNRTVVPPKFEDEVIDKPKPDNRVEDPIVDIDESEFPVSYKVKTPKPSLWKKIAKIVVAGVAFLAGLGAAIQTGRLAGKAGKNVDSNSSKEASIETTESETKIDKTTKEEKPTVTPSVEKKEDKVINPTVAKTEESVPVVKEEPKETVKEEVKPAIEESKEEIFPIEIEKNESVFNTETGVEVTYSGSAGTEDEILEDRELEHNKDGKALVTKEDLTKESTVDVPTVEAIERTGKEVSEEEAKANMSPEEVEKANDAIEEYFRSQGFDIEGEQEGRSR